MIRREEIWSEGGRKRGEEVERDQREGKGRNEEAREHS